MIALQVEYLIGPNAGRKLLIRQTRISFGRSTDRVLPVDQPFISREHGEFAFDQGQWQLINHSPNGTILNGKRITKKPRPIKANATVTIGDTDVFRVSPIVDEADLHAAAEQPITDTTATATPEPAVHSSAGGRTKLWIGIAVFWAVALGLIAFSLLNQSNPTTTSPGDNLPAPITAEQIEGYIHRPIDKQPPDQRKADTAVAQARESYALIDRRTDALYRAYEAYRNALTYTAADALPDATDQRQYFILQKRLAEGVTEKYEDAIVLFKSRQYKAADEAFKDLRDFYPAPESPVFKDALKREAAARQALERRR